MTLGRLFARMPRCSIGCLLMQSTLLAAPSAGPWVAHYVPLSLADSAEALAADSSGNLFVVASIESSGKPETCAFKMDVSGNTIGRLCFLNSVYGPIGVATDPQGNLVVAGTTLSASTFPLVSPVISHTTPEAGYVMKLDAGLTTIVFSTLIGGTKAGGFGAGTNINALAIDGAGNIFVAGQTWDADFPVTMGAFQTTLPKGVVAGFVTSISFTMDHISYSSLFAGPPTSCSPPDCVGSPAVSATRIVADKAGAVVIAGYALGEEIPTSAQVLGATCVCASNEQATFVAKIAPGGAKIEWATYLNFADVAALAIDGEDDIIVGGSARPGFVPTRGALQASLPNVPGMASSSANYQPYPGFISKLDPQAHEYIFATYFGGYNVQESISTNKLLSSTNGVKKLMVDSDGTIWVTGGSLTSILPLPNSVPVLGSTYIVGLTSDGSSETVAVTAPEGAAGQDLAVSPYGAVALGKSGSVLIPSPNQALSVSAILNSAGLSATGSVAPNEVVSFYGANLGPVTPLFGQVVGGNLTTSLGGTKVLFGNIPAPLLFVGPNQINAVVPSQVTGHTSTTVKHRYYNRANQWYHSLGFVLGS